MFWSSPKSRQKKNKLQILCVSSRVEEFDPFWFIEWALSWEARSWRVPLQAAHRKLNQEMHQEQAGNNWWLTPVWCYFLVIVHDMRGLNSLQYAIVYSSLLGVTWMNIRWVIEIIIQISFQIDLSIPNHSNSSTCCGLLRHSLIMFNHMKMRGSCQTSSHAAGAAFPGAEEHDFRPGATGARWRLTRAAHRNLDIRAIILHINTYYIYTYIYYQIIYIYIYMYILSNYIYIYIILSNYIYMSYMSYIYIYMSI